MFGKGRIFNSIYSKPSATIRDVDLRAEFKNTLENDKIESVIILRRARRDQNGNPILSESTLQNRSNEAVEGTNERSRYLFDDLIITGYVSHGSTYHEGGEVVKYGDSRSDNLKVFLKHDCISAFTKNLFDIPDPHDRIVIPEMDIEGNLRSPLTIKEIYDILSVTPFRLNGNGRVEFYSINLMSTFEKSSRL